MKEHTETYALFTGAATALATREQMATLLHRFLTYAGYTLPEIEPKTPPAAVLIKKACGIETASGTPNKTKVASLTKEQVRKIAETKMPDLNASSVESAMSMVAGTARSMGVTVED